MCSCIIKNCQYNNFFDSKEFIQDKKLYYVEGSDSLDEYCLFHAPEEVKEKFTYYQNELFKRTILDYIDFCIIYKQTIDFSQSVFHVPFEVNDLKEVETIDFTETIFIEYFRMDNLECKKIIFKDTEFHDGGGIKNRNGNKEVQIENLIFRPYQLESDFVIDIGKYANDMGRIESNHYGVIKKIKFENHKKGKGIVYFIGFNEYVEEANFRNMILDYVSFQNCDLSKCYFLNAKVDKTEFRNCEFEREKDFLGKYQISVLFVPFVIIILTIVQYLINSYFGADLDEIESTLNSPNLWIYSFMILIGLFLIPFYSKHVILYDEKQIKHKNEKIRQETWEGLSETYKMLRINLSSRDFQKGGDFFYTQRLSQLFHQYSKRRVDTIIYLLHYIVNGFGERYIRPIIWFVLTIIFFSGMYEKNDFIATDKTPHFLIVDKSEPKQDLNYYKKQFFKIYKKNNDTNITRIYISDALNNNWTTNLTYSASQFVSPFTAKNRGWFKTISSKALMYNLVETILLYFFFGAFLLAVKNRIKR